MSAVLAHCTHGQAGQPFENAVGLGLQPVGVCQGVQVEGGGAYYCFQTGLAIIYCRFSNLYYVYYIILV